MLRVSIGEEFGETVAYVKEIEPRLIQQFEPIKISDDPIMGLVGCIPPEYARLVTVKRKDYADLLAREISAEIMKYIERNDTVNGYKVKDQQ